MHPGGAEGLGIYIYIYICVCVCVYEDEKCDKQEYFSLIRIKKPGKPLLGAYYY